MASQDPERTSSVRPGSATLRDVAKASNVSITTVSRIINGRESGIPIKESTRTRVTTIAAQLGYKPNLLARGLRGSRSSLLGVIARDISDPFHTQVLTGINQVSQARDYRLFLGHVDYRPDVALTYGSMFERSHADGIILIGDIAGGDEAFDIIATQHRFVIGVTDRTERLRIPGVYSDSTVGTGLALEHLWGLGHRAVTCVSDTRTHDGRRRIEAYEAFMRAHDVAERIRVEITDQEPAQAFELGQRMFAASDVVRPTAIYATSDTTAIGLMQAAYQANLVVPDDISIIGYDDIDFAAFAIPPLTTISQSGAWMGRLAAELLLDMIELQSELEDVTDVMLSPTLVVRRSTAPAPV